MRARLRVCVHYDPFALHVIQNSEWVQHDYDDCALAQSIMMIARSRLKSKNNWTGLRLQSTYLVVLNKGRQIFNHVLVVTLPQQVNFINAILPRFGVLNFQNLFKKGTKKKKKKKKDFLIYIKAGKGKD